MKEYYSNHFANSEKNKWVYTIDSFLQEIGNRNFFQIKKYNTIIKMKDYIFKKLVYQSEFAKQTLNDNQ